MHIQVLQHVPFEDIGSIRLWADQQKADVRYTRFYAGDELPANPAGDLIVVMGGPMSVNDDTQYPWLQAEKRWIRNCLDKDIPVLGICLGAQLIAAALNARVYGHTEKEIGWFPITATGGAPSALAWPDSLPVLHWHGETFELPANASLWASSEACPHQVFSTGRRVIGMQCHLETDQPSLNNMIQHCRHELTGGRYVQDEAQLLAQLPANQPDNQALLFRCLDYLVAS